MNKSILMKLGLSLLVMTFTINPTWSQETETQKKIYTTTGGELIYHGLTQKTMEQMQIASFGLRHSLIFKINCTGICVTSLVFLRD